MKSNFSWCSFNVHEQFELNVDEESGDLLCSTYLADFFLSRPSSHPPLSLALKSSSKEKTSTPFPATE